MTPMVGGATARQLINHCGSVEAIFRDKPHHLSRIPGIGPKIISSLKNNQHLLQQAYEEIDRCHRQGITILGYEHPQYPERLRHIYDIPLVLYYKGKADLNHQRVISIVGTRQATSYGLDAVEKIVATLAKYDVLIISGLAYGIDIQAHRMAMRYGLPTVAVMANGIDQIYPAVHQKDAWSFVEKGGLLTENPLGTKPEAKKFPARNRIIAGLADAVVVVEAASKGGALITADLANDYDREVFAVPGSIHHQYSRGCNQLIRQHKAHLLSQGEDIITMLNWDLEKDINYLTNQPKIFAPPEELNEDEQKVYKVLTQHPDGLLLDKISWCTQLSISQLAAVLLNLEFKQYVRARPGNRYQLRTV
ncbi:DNA-processing protein DprA [Tunicatimonas pelagia]|uniref:DNA-processing protein DprA n=1 Tax=Tunicatimonas pelagia TaxID=931531 RepID=UPI0026658963|nr:DNA-processing protein DprA [Tunicatimonas pelagia]WKN41580.1 DNA-processing protein DprA [Tunicatimonas pelagia]